MFSSLASLPVLTPPRASAGTVLTPRGHCPQLRLSDCSSPVWCRLLSLQGSTTLMQPRCLRPSPFQGLHYSCNTLPAFCSVPVERHPCHAWDSHGCAGGHLVHPHHLPYTRGFREPAAVLLQDPSSLISFNSPLETWVSKEAEIFFLYLSQTCCHNSISIFLWCKQKAPYAWAVQDVSCTLKQTNSKNHHTSKNIQLYSLGSHTSPTPIYYCFALELPIGSKSFGFQKRLLVRQTPIKNIKQVLVILKKLYIGVQKKKSYMLTS